MGDTAPESATRWSRSSGQAGTSETQPLALSIRWTSFTALRNTEEIAVLMLRRRTVGEWQREIEGLLVVERVTEAEAKALQALRRYPRDARLHVLLASSVMELDRDRAISAANHAVDLDPSNVELLLDVAWMMLALDPAGGRAIGARIGEFDTRDPQLLGRLAYLKGRYSLIDAEFASAAAYFREALDVSPKSEAYLEGLIDALFGLGREDEARVISDRALRDASDSRLLEKQRVRLGL